MENIHIEKTSKTPEVIFDFEKRYLEIKGVSIPEDSESFYRPLMDWVVEYVSLMMPQVAENTLTDAENIEETEQQEEEQEEQKPDNQTLVSLKLIYFNTSTADYLVNILRKLREIQIDYPPIMDNGTFNPDDAPTHIVTIEWCYEIEDDDMYDTGTHFESVLEMPFTYVAVDEIV